MANPFVEGFRLSRADTAQRKANDLNLRAGEQALQDAQYAADQARVKDTRTTKAYDALEAEHGAIAGDPTRAGQLAGIQRNAQNHEDAQTDRDELRARQAHTAALNAVETKVRAGGDATEALMALPPAYRQSVGLTDEAIAELGGAIGQDPAIIAQLRQGLEGKPTNPEYETGVDSDTKKPVFFTRDPNTNKPVIVDGVVPTHKAAGTKAPGSGGSGGGGYFAPIIKDGVAYIRGKDGSVSVTDVGSTLAAQARQQVQYGSTSGTESAKDDRAALESLPQAIQSSKNMVSAIDEVLNDPNLELAVGSPSFDKLLAGGTGAFGLEWPGSKAADAAARVEYIRSAAFAEAFETLKGGGPITEVEGTAATVAYSNLQRSRSAPEFERNLLTFKTKVQTMREEKERRAKAAQSGASSTSAPEVVAWDSYFQ